MHASISRSPTLPLRLPRSGLRRGLLAAGCAAAVLSAHAAAVLSAHAAAAGDGVEMEAALRRLLRGMALLKAAGVAAALAAVSWRLGAPLSNGLTAAYVLGVWTTAGASMLIWELAYLPWAAVAFHAGLALLGLAAVRDLRLPGRSPRAGAREEVAHVRPG